MLLAMTLFACRTPEAPAGLSEWLPLDAVLTASVDDRVKLVGTGREVEFRVSVTGPDGEDISGDVLFVAPDFGGPSGDFLPISGQVIDSSYVRVPVQDGEAVATLLTNDTEGLYFVEATVPGQDHTVRFPVTQVDGRERPDLSLADVQSIVGELTGPDSRAYGPFVIDAGDRLQPITDADSVPEDTVEVNAPTWALWIDDAPDRKFHHPTRLVAIPDGSSSSTDAVRIEASTWAEHILAQSAEPVPLLPPSSVNDAVWWQGEEEEPLTSGRYRSHLSVPFPPNTCGVVVNGPPDRYIAADALRMIYFMDNELHLARVYHKRVRGYFSDEMPAMTRGELESTFRTARSDGCRGLVLYISSHGYSVGAGRRGVDLAAGTSPVGRKRMARVSWDELATDLGDRFDRVDLIVDACYSEHGATLLQGRDFEGSLISSAAEGELSQGSPSPPAGSYYSLALIECWNDLVDVGVADGLAEAHDCVLRTGGSRATDPLPAYNRLDSEFIEMPPENFSIASVSGARWFGQGTAHPDMAADRFQRRGSLVLSVPGVVEPTNPYNPVVMGGMGAGPAFDMNVVGPGVTPYVLVSRVAKKAFYRTGTFQVTTVCPVVVDPSASNTAPTGGADDPFASIQAAIDARGSCGEIEVLPGTYTEHLRIDGDLTLTSRDGAATTILDGGANGRVVSLNSGRFLELTGFTIQNGVAPVVAGEQIGGALYVDGAIVTLDDIVFRNNTASEGGAIFANATDLDIRACRFENNDADKGGAIRTDDARRLSIVGSVFDGNTGFREAGAIHHRGGELTVQDTRFASNRAYGNTAGGGSADAGAMSISDSTSVDIGHCWFEGNSSADRGGAIRISLGPGVIHDSVFVDNSRDAIAIDPASRAAILNNTFYGNGVAIAVDSAPNHVANNIFAECSESTVLLFGDRWTQFWSNNLLYSSDDGFVHTAWYETDDPPDPIGTRGNFQANPGFVNAAGHVFELNALSPAIDAGRPVSLSEDYDHGPRVNGAGIDLGAYER